MSEVKEMIKAEGDIVYPTPEIVQCPFPLYKKLQSEAPYVHRTDKGEYLISRPEDILFVAKNTQIFSNFIGPVTPGLCEAYRIDPATADNRAAPTPWPTPFTDGKDHDDKRALLNGIIAPEKMATYEPIIRRVADDIIDEIADSGRCEFKMEFARRIPARVMLEVIGVPHEDADELAVRLSGGGAGGQGIRHATPEQRAENALRMDGIRTYFRALMQKRWEDPKDDFLSRLMQEKMARDGRLDLEFLITDVIVLYGASFGNTVDMMVQTLYHLIKHPDVMARCVEKPSLIAKAIEETLRIEAPVQWVARRVLEDTELSGVKIPKESICLVMYGAANRDDAKFEDAGTFNIDRPRLMSHMAFGFGEHRCLGAPLAQMEGRVALERVLARLTNIAIAPGHEHIANVESSAHRALVELPITFEKRA